MAPLTLMSQAWTSHFLMSVFIFFMKSGSGTVTFNSSISHHGRTRVCPSETILYECFVMGPDLVWILPDIRQHYDENSDKNIVNNTGPASLWFSNNTSGQLKSTLVLTYAPKFNNKAIQCNNKTCTYIIADNPESPVLSDPLLICQSDTSVDYLLQWSQPSSTSQDLDHYQLSIKFNGKDVSNLFVSALDNKTIISASIGVPTTIAVTAVNKCGQKSAPAEKQLNTTLSTRHNYIVYILAALAILFCLLCIVLMMIILVFVFWRLKHTSNQMRMKPAKPISKRSDAEPQLSKRSEGFPLLGPRGSDRDSS